ncbi:arsenical-resistance protein 2 [Staphylotrichum tortipilum]|uniref:Arsenical-resistance protein 2 n=1 Tax=Staphylotrichum tortipilum TaxID=2831512 RepID=A0AAN6RV92_9PEZI|nr:arsenical-resistance protein 2 [Staphylotrichum longicolle]
MAVSNHTHHHGHGHGHAHEHCLKMARRVDGTPWWSDFPEPISVSVPVEPAHVHRILQEQAHTASADKPRDFLLVDARRTDCTGGTVRGAMNLPAHSFYPTRKILYDLCKQAGIKTVIFYCGSSLGRGPRCAAWLQDYVHEDGGNLESRVMVGGIRGWVRAYGGGMMDGYDEQAWQVEEAR